MHVSRSGNDTWWYMFLLNLVFDHCTLLNCGELILLLDISSSFLYYHWIKVCDQKAYVSFLPCLSVCWCSWSIVHINPHRKWQSLTELCWWSGAVTMSRSTLNDMVSQAFNDRFFAFPFIQLDYYFTVSGFICSLKVGLFQDNYNYPAIHSFNYFISISVNLSTELAWAQQ